MIQRFLSLPGGLYKNLQVLFKPVLPYEFVKGIGTQGRFHPGCFVGGGAGGKYFFVFGHCVYLGERRLRASLIIDSTEAAGPASAAASSRADLASPALKPSAVSAFIARA